MQRDGDNRVWWIVGGVLVVVLLFLPVLGGGMMGPGMMGGYPGYGTPGLTGPATGNGWLWGLGTGLGWLMMLAFWGALIAGAVLLFRAVASGSHAQARTGETALDVLKRRFAAGEVTREQYEEMRQVLEK
jgi:putative membrane protein